MKNELKCCPFCGGKARMVIAPLMGTRAFICDKCGADVMFYGAEKDTQKAQRIFPKPLETFSNSHGNIFLRFFPST